MIISLENAGFTYVGAEHPALRSLSFAVAPGEVLGILGRSGAGKSTLCLLLSGFMPQFYQGEAQGTVIVDGKDVLALGPAELAHSIGLVLSDPFSQISGTRFTVLEEVAFGLENLGLPRDEIIDRSEWALAALGLADLHNRSPYSLSGGQQQRLVLAAALAMRPRVLVLDQPAAQLDPRTVMELADLLRGLTADGTTIVVAEARSDWLARLADRVLLLHEGKARALSPTAELLRDPLLRELRIGWPQPTRLAAALQERGLWPAEQPLPTTPEELQAALATRAGAREAQSPEHGAQRVASSQQTLNTTLPLNPTPNTQHPTPKAEPLVVMENVRFRYPGGVEALREVSLTIGGGERIALIGRNGAGKSTLLRHFNGLLLPSTGRVLVAGTDTHKQTVAQSARTAALSFQDVRNQLFSRTVRQELAFGPQNLGYPTERCTALVEQALAETGLTSVADEHPYDLLPQQRRFVAIAAALAMATPLLVLDEPSAGMDDEGLERLRTIIDRRVAAGASVVLVSHDIDFCSAASDRVLLLADGRLAVDGYWHSLSPAQRAVIDEQVGLPLSMLSYDS